MALLVVQLYQSLRSRVELGETAVRITLPQGSGATPMLRFVNSEIPYEQIEAVETRCVLFGNAMAPVLLRATRLLTKDGGHIRLGNVNEDNVDQALPFPEIGAKIAQRAGVKMVDGGTVRRSIERRVLGFIGRKTTSRTARPSPAAESTELNGRHKRAPCTIWSSHGRAGGRRHRDRRLHRAANVVCQRGRISARGKKR